MASLRVRTGDAKQWAATQVCIWCHSTSAMMARYGLNTDPVESYLKDFHRLTARGTRRGLGHLRGTATRRTHSLPASTPSPDEYHHRGTACGECHGQGASPFAMPSPQKAMQLHGAKIEGVAGSPTSFIILGSVAGMLAHNFLQWIWAVRRNDTGRTAGAEDIAA